MVPLPCFSHPLVGYAAGGASLVVLSQGEGGVTSAANIFPPSSLPVFSLTWRSGTSSEVRAWDRPAFICPAQSSSGMLQQRDGQKG